MDPWTETYNATYFRSICWQVFETNLTGQSEDCLHLNIFSPDAEGSGYPVSVYIHGGSFVGGDGIDSFYDGRPMVGVHEVVYVTIQYRLNAFGFLTTGDPELQGNYGLWDQNMALKWIQENIASFGGDPTKIAIMGQSAGAGSVRLHLIAEASWDYFNRGILVVLRTTTNIKPLVPVIDRDFITDDPRVLLQQKKFKDCDILAGDTKDDGSFIAAIVYPDQVPEHDPYSDYATFTDKVSHYLYTYTNDIIVNSIAQQYVDWKDFDNETTNYFYKYIEMITDEAFHCPTEHTAREYAKNGNNVYRYYFNYLAPGTVQIPSWYGVGHSNDMKYIFASFMNPRQNDTFTPIEKQFSLDMMQYYYNFVKTGNPNLPRQPYFEWEPFTVPGLNILEQKPVFANIPGARAEFNAFWNDYLPKLVTYSADLSEVEHQWREEFNRWKNDDLPAWRLDFNEYQESTQCKN